MALTLARPQGNPAGGRGLALFYLETHAPDGRLNGIRVNRLKDKLGTRKVPTAELELEGAVAVPVAGLEEGIKQIALFRPQICAPQSEQRTCRRLMSLLGTPA